MSFSASVEYSIWARHIFTHAKKTSKAKIKVIVQIYPTHVGLTLSHHAGTQALLETTGLARLPPSLGDLAVIHHRTTVLDVS